MPKGVSKQQLGILIYIVDCITDSMAKKDIIANLQQIYKIKERQAYNYFDRAIKYIGSQGRKQADFYFNLIYEKYSQLYRQCEQRDDDGKQLLTLKDEIKIKLDITNSLRDMVGLSGREGGDKTQNNIFLHFPDQSLLVKYKPDTATAIEDRPVS